ncbi:MAG TPA: hypothetical protein GX743_09820 [Actinomycetales bacterium]|nr:hypothetical protein [Actinomycetales bacterium]
MSAPENVGGPERTEGGPENAGTPGTPRPGGPDSGEELETRSDVVNRVIDAAVTYPSKGIHKRVDRLREANPNASPERIVELLERDYLKQVARVGGTVGATAAVPAFGTAVAVGLAGVQFAEFLTDSALHVMAVADVHGVPLDDVERRRALLLSTLLGEAGAAAVQQELGVSGLYWARALISKVPLASVRSLNARLRRMVLRQTARSGGRVALGRLLPFGVGAVIGYAGARRMGREVVAGARSAFGPAPRRFARERGEVLRMAEIEVLDGREAADWTVPDPS